MADKPVTTSYDKFASDPERWSKIGRMGLDPDTPPTTFKSLDEETKQIKKGSFSVPKMCSGGKVLKTWSK